MTAELLVVSLKFRIISHFADIYVIALNYDLSLTIRAILLVKIEQKPKWLFWHSLRLDFKSIFIFRQKNLSMYIL